MKFIHCGDIHLDSKIESNLPTAKSKERKKEILMSFCKVADYAVETKVTAVIIAGDLFDTDRISSATSSVLINKISECESVDFLYLAGNHDAGKTLSEMQLPSNFKMFSDTWSSYTYGDVVISGAELTVENCKTIYDSLILNKDKFNIVTMHGELRADYGVDVVNKNELVDRNIDYLALGHYHTFTSGRLDDRGKWCYCGCLDGRGFDECGDKGFMVLDIENKKIVTATFEMVSKRGIYEVECDVTGLVDTGSMLNKINEAVADIDAKNMVKVVLIGNLPKEAHKDIEFLVKHLNERFWFAKVKDKTKLLINPEEYINDISLKGEFIRLAVNSGLDKELVDRIISQGLAALSGEEVL